MVQSPVSLRDLARSPGEVARGLAAWQRGDHEDAVLQTLAASAGTLHDRRYTLWVWAGRSSLGDPVWVLPVSVAEAIAFAPKSVARILAGCLAVAIEELDAVPALVRLEDWNGRVALVLPGLEEELAGMGIADAHPGPGAARLGMLPDPLTIDGAPVALPPAGVTATDGIARMARELHRHPIEVVIALAGQRQRPIDVAVYSADLVTALRAQGIGERPPPEPVQAPSLAIDDDPCPLRRHARTVLQRMLRMGKVGPGYHTEFDHFSRGAAAHDRRQALEVGEALVRAGLLIEKPSVGQRHISLNVRRLPEIHALIDRGETRDPELAELWSAPPPGS